MKAFLPYAEFYITNVCNFNCPGCARFNNFQFAGTQRWEDYSEQYRQWADIVDIDRWAILGGEPMTNPTYLDWLDGLCKLWPQSRGSIVSNGHYFKSDNQRLYNILQSTNGLVKLEIGLHNRSRLEDITTRVRTWLKGNITEWRGPKDYDELYGFADNWRHSYRSIKDPAWPDCDDWHDWINLSESIRDECEHQHRVTPDLVAETRQDFMFCDSNGVIVRVAFEDWFTQPALIADMEQKEFRLHHSDPVQAHDICTAKTCHTFDKGRLFKCGLVNLFKEFDQQFGISVTDEERELLHSYQPAMLDNDPEDIVKFIEQINNPIDQCRFCPTQSDNYKITAGSGQKPVMPKRKITWLNATHN